MENSNISLPKCGIIIATFNNAQWLMGAIHSVINNDYPSKVLYVVSDASTDNTDQVMASIPEFTTPNFILKTEDIAKVARKTAWHQINGVDVLYIVLKENHGPSFARNLAIQNAIHTNQCQIIAILDADDKMMPGKLSKCVAQILSDPQSIGGVYGDYAIYNVDTGQMTYESKWCYDLFKLKKESIVHSGAVYSSLALQFVKQNIGSYYFDQLTTAEDWAINKVISNRFLFIHIPEILTLVRAHNNSSTQYRSEEEWNRNWQFVANL